MGISGRMADGENKDAMMSEEELLKLLLYEDDEVKDEGRELYLEEILKKIRTDLDEDDTL